MHEHVKVVGTHGGAPSVEDTIVEFETKSPANRAHRRAPLRNLDILHLWETGQSLGPIDRALTILGVAYPSHDLQEHAQLPIGARDSRLLAVREATFGSVLTCLALCPACGEKTELALDAADLQNAMRPPAGASVWHVMAFDGWEIEFRLPNSRDLADALAAGDPESAQARLVQVCILDARLNGETATPTSEVLERVFAEMARLDPGAEMNFELACPSCDYEWESPFDIVSFLWIEIDALAKRLLHEVATLAHAYGWREADILELSSVRRQAYLDLV